jgi:hypothetical protein
MWAILAHRIDIVKNLFDSMAAFELSKQPPVASLSAFQRCHIDGETVIHIEFQQSLVDCVLFPETSHPAPHQSKADPFNIICVD